MPEYPQENGEDTDGQVRMDSEGAVTDHQYMVRTVPTYSIDETEICRLASSSNMAMICVSIAALFLTFAGERAYDWLSCPKDDPASASAAATLCVFSAFVCALFVAFWRYHWKAGTKELDIIKAQSKRREAPQVPRPKRGMSDLSRRAVEPAADFPHLLAAQTREENRRQE